MHVQAHCSKCGWKAKASDNHYAGLAAWAHYRATGHDAKLKP